MRIRDFIKGKIQEAEDILKYESCVVIKQNSDNQTVVKVYFDYSGNSDMHIVRSFDGTGTQINHPSRSVTVPTHLYHTQNIPVDPTDSLNSIAPILDIIPQITSYQSNNSSYATQNSEKSHELAQKNQELAEKNQEVSQKSQEVAQKKWEVSQKNQEIAQKNREITEVQQKIAGLQSQENSLQSQINSFQIGDNIKALNAKQKAHILQKLWGNGDADSVSVIN
ncbi:hypothetical protein [Candidatus Tisiphia endosymbiont of Mystacides longicornis]|uniref:hypothetical protein n=1 Tax=Candidatus Tisiphia endosymbiont of Mystacides longicornis TaxID=3139330 RepID=UPI003CCB1DD3